MCLDHIALIVSKEENLKFYEKLGFKEIDRIDRKYDKVVFMKCDEIALEIFVDSRHPRRKDDIEFQGLRHIAFCVKNLEEIMSSFLCSKTETDWFGKKYILLKDPDGQLIELKEG